MKVETEDFQTEKGANKKIHLMRVSGKLTVGKLMVMGRMMKGIILNTVFMVRRLGLSIPDSAPSWNRSTPGQAHPRTHPILLLQHISDIEQQNISIYESFCSKLDLNVIGFPTSRMKNMVPVTTRGRI